MPFGISSAPRVFTKLIRAALAPLRKQGIRISAYLDDFCALASTKKEAERVAKIVREHLEALGFILNEKKCVWEPTQLQEFLGFEIDTRSMEIRLPQAKLRRVCKEVKHTLTLHQMSARKIASLIGLLNSTAEAVLPARMKYRFLLRNLHQALQNGKGNWEYQMKLTYSTRRELEWWLTDLKAWNGKAILIPAPRFEAETDASDTGWGAVVKNTPFRVQGQWSRWEIAQSINYRELATVLFLIQMKAKEWQGQSIRVWTDNITTRAYINHQGGTSSEQLNNLAMQIWELCLQYKIHLVAAHIPGVENKIADGLSRSYADRNDWMLNLQVFQALQQWRGPFTIDLFASRLNYQLPIFYSWKPDPQAAGIDAFMHYWPKQGAFANPPWGLIPRVLAKIREEKCTITLIAPRWPTQHWYADLLQMSCKKPLILPQMEDLFIPV